MLHQPPQGAVGAEHQAHPLGPGRFGTLAFQGSLPAPLEPFTPGNQGLVTDPCFPDASLIEGSPRRMLSTVATFSKTCLLREAAVLQLIGAILLMLYTLLPRGWYHPS